MPALALFGARHCDEPAQRARVPAAEPSGTADERRAVGQHHHARRYDGGSRARASSGSRAAARSVVGGGAGGAAGHGVGRTFKHLVGCRARQPCSRRVPSTSSARSIISIPSRPATPLRYSRSPALFVLGFRRSAVECWSLSRLPHWWRYRAASSACTGRWTCWAARSGAGSPRRSGLKAAPHIAASGLRPAAQWVISAGSGRLRGGVAGRLPTADYPQALWFQRAIGVICLAAFAATFLPRARRPCRARMIESAPTSSGRSHVPAPPMTPEHPQVSVVIPIYNEEENLPDLVERVGGALSRTGRGFELICVDDGSKDDSAATAGRAGL